MQKTSGQNVAAPKGEATAKTEWRAILHLAPFLWPKGRTGLKLRVILALLCLIGAKIANVWVPIFLKQAVDSLSDSQSQILAIPFALIFAYGFTRLMAVIFQELREAFSVKVIQGAIRVVAMRVFQHLHNLSLRFHLDRQTGGLNLAIERGVRGIDTLLAFMLFNIIPTFVEILLICGILWGLYDIYFAVITLAMLVIYIFFTIAMTEWRMKFRRQMNHADQDANTKAVDSLLNYETVKYFSNESHEAQRYDSALLAYQKAAISSVTSLSANNIGQGLVIALGLMAVMSMAASGVVGGRMTVGDFVLVNAYLIQLYIPLNFLGFVYRTVRQAVTDMDKMFSVLEENQEVKDRPHAQNAPANKAVIRFEQVHFAYMDQRPILKGISFTVDAGKTVAIVGPSGAGKSTISRLLFRFYDVTAGKITLDGIDLRDMKQTSLRRAIGIVPQDTVLFNDTIRYNIAYGSADASEEAINMAAKLANIDGFIADLPHGMDTLVGERGLKLSGGEKQRVAIARTILKNPGILIFDEATSALDTATEKEIQFALKEVSQDRTTVIIAHRLSTVIDADQILVLEAGKIVETGKHRDLLHHQGIYARMWATQQDQQSL